MFGVNYAIAGSLQPISNRLRLTLTLIDSRTLRQLNSKVIDIDASEVLELQNKSVENLLAMLNLELNLEKLKSIDEGNTSNTVAIELYLQGLGFYSNIRNNPRSSTVPFMLLKLQLERVRSLPWLWQTWGRRA